MKSPTILLVILFVCLNFASYKFGEAREKSRHQADSDVIGGIPVITASGKPAESTEIIAMFRDYQIDICTDSIAIYDGQRLVGKYATDWKKDKFDSIIIKDNE